MRFIYVAALLALQACSATLPTLDRVDPVDYTLPKAKLRVW